MNLLSMKVNKYIFLLGAIFLIFIACQKEMVSMKIVNASCENRINPLGMDVLNPNLSWKLESKIRNKKQTAFQILVSDSKELLRKDTGNLWDSKKQNSEQSIQIKYRGKPLSSGMICYWKVRVWDESGVLSDWSDIATWEMGLLNENDWKADWIYDGKSVPRSPKKFYEDDPAPLFSYKFKSEKQIEKARLYITGLGYYEASINGKKVGDHVLDPGWTNYSKRIQYSTYNVTDLLNKGGNSIGVMLGNGWFNPLPLKMFGRFNLRDALPTGRPQFIAQLKIEFTDGTSQTIISNEEWRTHEGPILRNNIYLGEVYDARSEIANWDTFQFDDSKWNNVKIATKKQGRLQAQNQPPIRITANLKPVKLTEPTAGVYLFDMGQNFSGWAKLKVDVPAGTKIKLRYGELIHKDGSLNVMTSVAGQIKKKNSGSPFAPEVAWQEDTYIAKGTGVEYYTPRFTWHAFRYVEVSGLSEKPKLDAIEGLRLNSDIKRNGSFECSNKLFNEIQNITDWTFMSNIFSVQSDCPHRERFGYGGDLAVTSDAFIYNYDMSNFYAKVVRDFQDAALPDGLMTDTAPFVGINYCGIGWAFSHPLTLLELYQYYGNISLIEEQYETSRKWFEGVILNNDLIITEGLSDHESLAIIPTSEMVTPLYYQSAKIMAQLAEIINRTEDVEKYSRLSEQIKKAYLEKFHDKGTGRFAPYTQASQSFALYTGIAPKDEINNAVLELVKNIEEKNGHLTSGIFGTKYSLEVLSENGFAETAAQMVDKKTFPSWGHMIENGATTLWEHWEYSDNTFSHNHPMFGSVSEWFYKWVAGIQADPTAVGFNKIVIRPQLVSNVNWAKGTYNSVHGKISSDWKREGNSFRLEITIPVNTTATIYLPAKNSTGIKEGGSEISQVKDIRLIKSDKGIVVLSVGSGDYSFESTLN